MGLPLHFVREEISTQKVDRAIQRRRNQAKMRGTITICQYVIGANFIFILAYGVFHYVG